MKPARERPPRPAPPPPLEADDLLVVRVITAGWAVALVVLLIVRGSLPAGQRWWIWTCACGLAFGLFGLWYVPRLKRGRARSAARRADGEQVKVPRGSGGFSRPRGTAARTRSPRPTPPAGRPGRSRTRR